MKLLDKALFYLGKKIKELSGSSSHPQIAAWIKRIEKKSPTDLNQDDSTYAWCGVAVANLVLEVLDDGSRIDAPPSYPQRASSWEKWGRDVTASPIRGDVVVMKRPGGKHVTILNSFNKEAGTMVCIGGNQSDEFRASTYNTKDIITIRRSISK